MASGRWGRGIGLGETVGPDLMADCLAARLSSSPPASGSPDIRHGARSAGTAFTPVAQRLGHVAHDNGRDHALLPRRADHLTPQFLIQRRNP